MKVVIIGTGNVASVFGKKIARAGHRIVQVVGRNAERASALAAEFKCASTSQFSDLIPSGDIYIIAVTDQAVVGTASHLNIRNGIVVHTAAGVRSDVLAGSAANYGVLYPLQSLRREMSVIPKIPILLDANN